MTIHCWWYTYLKKITSEVYFCQSPTAIHGYEYSPLPWHETMLPRIPMIFMVAVGISKRDRDRDLLVSNGLILMVNEAHRILKSQIETRWKVDVIICFAHKSDIAYPLKMHHKLLLYCKNNPLFFQVVCVWEVLMHYM